LGITLCVVADIAATPIRMMGDDGKYGRRCEVRSPGSEGWGCGRIAGE